MFGAKTLLCKAGDLRVFGEEEDVEDEHKEVRVKWWRVRGWEETEEMRGTVGSDRGVGSESSVLRDGAWREKERKI